ncbi:MAG: DUF523 domain-containing protein [Actinobacteria bacterium]|nr:DUF523 domain-containing protein [Actinomycetota bacterium]
MNGGAKPPVLVSACLLGLPVRFDGGCRRIDTVLGLADSHTVIPVCPEQLGGLSTPRPPAEIQGRDIAGGGDDAGGRAPSAGVVVTTEDGRDVTAELERGARAVADIARLVGARVAVLKARSPSCGCGETYDGTFTGTLRPGSGVTAALLEREGVRVLTENDVPAAGLSISTGSDGAAAQGDT